MFHTSDIFLSCNTKEHSCCISIYVILQLWQSWFQTQWLWSAWNPLWLMITFIHSRASVVRGRVISGRGTGLRGVRVSHYRPADTGFTLTRTGGWFDLMVNGGGAVRLLFGKSPFSQVIATVWVPWNEVCFQYSLAISFAFVSLC